MKRFKIKLSADNKLVDEHRVDGLRVLPGIAYLDIIARCLKIESFELTQVTYPYPAKLNDGETIDLYIDLEEDTRLIEIYHYDNEIKIVHFKAAINSGSVLEPTLTSDFIMSPVPDLESQSMETIYRLARDAFINHGEFMRVLGTTQINGKRIRMDLSLNNQAKALLPHFYLHPVLLDGATFAIASLFYDEVSSTDDETIFLPLSIDKVTIYQRISATKISVLAEAIPSDHEYLIKCRLQIFTPEGQLILTLEGLTNKRFQRTQFLKAFNGKLTPHKKTEAATIETQLHNLLSQYLNVKPELLETHVSFFDLGFDSGNLIALVGEIEKQFNLELYPTLLFEHNTVEKLTNYVNELLYNKSQSAYENSDVADGEYSLYMPSKTELPFVEQNSPVLIISDNHKAIVNSIASLTFEETLELLNHRSECDDILMDVSYHDVNLNTQELLTSFVMKFKKLVNSKVKRFIIVFSPTQKQQIAESVAFISCVKEEYPQLVCAILVNEICNISHAQTTLNSGSSCVYYENQRYFISSYHAQGKTHKHSSLLKVGGHYLIVGGLGGLGRLLIRYLIEQYQANIHVIGRGPVNVAHSDVPCNYYQLDVRDPETLVSFFKQNQFIIDGVFYLAGLRQDSLLQNITPSQITDTLHSKLHGLKNVQLALQGKNVSFFCLYSSLSADLGNMGQSTYAVANASLNAYALQQEQLRIKGNITSRFISISWPYWLDGGMHIEFNYLTRLKRKYGFSPLNTSRAFELLEQALCSEVPHVLVANQILLRKHILKVATHYGEIFNKPKRINTNSENIATPHDKIVSDTDIAIIGISFELPDASDFESLWRNLSSGKSSIKRCNRNWTHVPYLWGGYLDNIASFDPLYFNISPRDAALMDPQERLFLANAWHCLEDAGYKDLHGREIGVIAASMFNLYQNHGVEQSLKNPELKLPQSVAASIANRVSYALDLTGPSFTLDSMCSSSLTAIEIATQCLLDQNIDSMLVGGVNLCSHPYKLSTLVQNKFLSASGISAPFSEFADGYIPGEGVAVLLLKNAKKAVVDGNSIYALIKGVAINHGGASSGFTVPSVLQQTRVIVKALEKSGVSPDEMSYLEAHGTGTSLGDPIELEGIKQVYGRRTGTEPLYVGSIKSNIGHLESAAGMASIIKVIAQFDAQCLAPSINALPLNPHLNIDNDAIEIVTDKYPLQHHLAGISSFGAGGSNAHLILQYYPYNRRQRTKTVYRKDNYWVQVNPQQDALNHTNDNAHFLKIEMIPCGETYAHARENVFQFNLGKAPNYFTCASKGNQIKKAVIFMLDAIFSARGLLDQLKPFIDANPDVQLLFVHQNKSHWLALHAAMLSFMGVSKHYYKNILIPSHVKLDNQQIIRIINNESQDPNWRMVSYMHDAERYRMDLKVETQLNASTISDQRKRICVLGGLGGVGRQFCQALLACGMSEFDIIGRAGLNKERQQWLDQCGPGIRYLNHNFLISYPSNQYDLVINCMGIMPNSSADKNSSRTELSRNLSVFIQTSHPAKLITISSLSALAGFSRDPEYAVYNAFLLDHSNYCDEHVLAYLPFISKNTTSEDLEARWLEWSKVHQGLDLITQDQMIEICRILLNLPAGEYVPFNGDVRQFKTYLKNECLHGSLNQSSKNQQVSDSATSNILHQIIHSILVIPVESIQSNHTFHQLGFNSITLTELAELLTKRYDISINPSKFFEFQTVSELQGYLNSITKISNNSPERVPNDDISTKYQDDIVICGYHGVFPQCSTPDDLWRALLNKEDCTQMPITERFSDTKMSDMKVGLINSYDKFDYEFFGISYEQAKYIDPQHRKLLELSWHVFEHAGVAPHTLKGCQIGVFVAIQFDDYAKLLDRAEERNLYQITGCSKTFSANRISHFYDFHGPSETIDTACSSSFSALNQAVLAINSGQCESALVLAVNLMCDIKTLELTQLLNVLSPTYTCRPFDAEADGYVKGEGIAGLWLLPNQKAIDKGLCIYAKIAALAMNHGGSAQSLTAPNLAAQKQLLKSIYNSNGLSIDDIDYFEAHATATRLGDPIEFSALNDVFKERDKPLYIGSIKSNIGHTEPVSGLAGIIKALLILEHQIVPPQANYERLNPHINLDESCFVIPTQSFTTKISSVAVNSFGFGGSNGHCVLSKCTSHSISGTPIKLTLTPFALSTCWFDHDKPIQTKILKKHLNDCYQQIWCRKAVNFITLDCFAYIVVFLRHEQQSWVRKLLQHLKFNHDITYIIVDADPDLKPLYKHLESTRSILFYYFSALYDYEITSSNLIESQRFGIFPLLTLVKELHVRGLSHEQLSFYLFSANAYQFKDCAVSPFSAGLHGLAQSLKKEYPAWAIECIDVTAVHFPLQALTLSSGGQAFPLVMADDGVWHRQLQAITLPINMPPYQDQVLVFIGGDGQVGKQLISEIRKDNPRVIIIACRNCESKTNGIFQWKKLDCTDEVSVQLFLDEIINSYGRIDYLFHLGAAYAESPVAALDPDTYLLQIQAKVLGTYHLIKYGEQRAVTQIIISSSAQVYTQNINRAAYSSACFYADAVVAAMQSVKTKLVHWGFWLQADEDKNKEMRSLGIFPITAIQGYQGLRSFENASYTNISIINVADSIKALMPIVADGILEDSELLFFNQGLTALEYLCFEWVKHHLVTSGIIWRDCENLNVIKEYNIDPEYSEYFVVLIKKLKSFEQKHYAPSGFGQIKSRDQLLQSRINVTKMYPQIVAFINLLSICIDNLMLVFKKKRTIQQVMFPLGQDDLVRAVYRDNSLAQFYNNALATIVQNILDTSTKTLHILELGAGTGATTQAILERCTSGFHYTFTDINPQFVQQAARRFANHPNFNTRIFDINKPKLKGQFDIVIASNVLHTANDIYQCLSGINHLLNQGGTLLINEATENSLFLASTFGLFKQWHSDKDQNRIDASPLLTSQKWQTILSELGFSVKVYPTPTEVHQSIFIALLDERIKSSIKSQHRVDSHARLTETSMKPVSDSDTILQLLAEHFECDLKALNLHSSMTDHGLDSLAAIHLTEKIKQKSGIIFSPTILLEETPIAQIVKMIQSKEEISYVDEC